MAGKKPKLQKKRRTIIIIGAALAGPTAAARAREIDENAEIILLERNTRVSYAMSGLALHLSGEVGSLEDLNRERNDFFKNVYDIDVRTETEAIAIDARKKQVLIQRHGQATTLDYDALIFAAGAASVKPVGVPDVGSGKTPANFHYFRTLDDLAAIKTALDAGKKRFVVLGGGSMGAEALDGLVRGGAEVTLVEKKLQFLPEYSSEIAGIAARSMQKQAKLIAGFKQLDFEAQGEQITAIRVDGQRIETDFVVSAIGVTPRTELLKRAGVKLLHNGSIRVDERCRTNVDGIYACSICVSVPQGKYHLWIPQAAVSDKTAQVAGENAAGGKASLGTITASQIIRLPGIEIGRTGLTYAEARAKHGKKNIESVFIHGVDSEPYMPGSSSLSLNIYYTKKKRKLVALEAAGKNIKSRLDAFTAALAGELSLDDLALLDFAYTPAFGTARDALNVAATVALQREAGQTSLVSLAEVRFERKKYFVLDVSRDATHAGFHDLHMPLEKIRLNLAQIQEKLKISKAKKIATLSETGRRGHLALRILSNAGIRAVNISGGKKQI